MNDHASPPDTPNNWQEVLTEMQEERTGLQQQIARLQSEREQLIKALVELVREDVTLSRQEILAQIGHEKPLREFLAELRADLIES